MEALLFPFLFAIPIAFGGSLWRLGQLLRGVLPARRGCRWARISVTLGHFGVACWLGWMIASCIWPYRCGEGFAAGYAAGAVGLFGAIWALLWLISEGLLLLCADASGTPETEA